MALKINDKAPDFTLPSTEGRSISLSKDCAGKAVILYFYPGDFTRVCTKEACEFRDVFPTINETGIMIYGISTDSLESHHRFRQQFRLPFHLLSDEKGAVSKLFKAKMPLLNISKRITYLLDENHRIKAVYQGIFEAQGHIHSMKEALRKLKR